MTPKEKAIELVDKFKYISYDLDDIENHKEGALITVEEILFVVSKYNDTQAEVSYWQEIKQEIEKL